MDRPNRNDKRKIHTGEIVAMYDDKQYLQALEKYASTLEEQLSIPRVSNCDLTPEDLIEFNKWTRNKMYGHRLYAVPKDLTAFYLENRDSIIANNKKHCY